MGDRRRCGGIGGEVHVHVAEDVGEEGEWGIRRKGLGGGCVWG